jgi:hypothetical protein
MRYLVAIPEVLQGVFRLGTLALRMQERVSLQRVASALVGPFPLADTSDGAGRPCSCKTA